MSKILIVDNSFRHRKAAKAAFADDTTKEVAILSDYTEATDRVNRGEKFDLALLDLLMPAEARTLGEKGMAFFGQEISVGYQLAVYLAIRGIPKVAVATDTGHHDHPASAMMDWFGGEPFRVNGSTLLFMHAPLLSDGAKDWGKILSLLEKAECVP